MIIENHPTSSGDPGALSFGTADPMDQSNYSLAVFVIPGDELRLLVLFDPAVIPPDAAERLLAQFAQALEAIPSHLDDPAPALPVLPEAERDVLDTYAFGPLLPSFDHEMIHDRIVRVAGERPESTALACGDEEVTYSELQSRSAALARRLTRGFRTWKY